MVWEVEYTDQFEKWWNSLEAGTQDAIDVSVALLEEKGPEGIERSRHRHMRELRIQHKGKPYRILYAFDPRRTAILLIGGLKGGDDRWYQKYVPWADDLYDEHLREIEGGSGG